MYCILTMLISFILYTVFAVYIYTLGPTINAHGQRGPIRARESGPHEGMHTNLI